MQFMTHGDRPSDLKNWAYETIKEAILDVRIQPGEQIRVEALAEQLGTSRTPIREALLRLENDGLARSEPRVGFFASEITRQDLTELFELREITESYAAEKAAFLMTDQEMIEVSMAHKESAAAVDQGDLDKFNEKEMALHTLIMKFSGNTRLIKITENLKDLTYRERRLALKAPGNVKESVLEHARIVNALLQKDGALARDTMKEHIQNVKERLLAYLEAGDLPHASQLNNSSGRRARRKGDDNLTSVIVGVSR
jgi:DNA-binding GntR family transcriptional regulator